MQTAVLKKWLVACTITLLGVFQLSNIALAQTSPNQLGGGIVINEILVQPTGTPGYDTDGNGTVATEDEFIELYNTSASPIDISGYQFWRASPDLAWFTFPVGSIVPVGGYAVVITKIQTGGTLPVVAGSLFFDANHTGGILTNLAGNIVLLNPVTSQYIQAVYGGAPAVDPTLPISNYTGFPVAATRVGTADDFGTYTGGVSLTRSPNGTTTIVTHTSTTGGTQASPGGAGTTAAVTGNIIAFNFNDNNQVADDGLPANLTKTINREPSFAGTYGHSTGASGSDLSTTDWDNGNGTKYYVTEFTTTGYENITVESKQRGSNTGPKDFKVQYSLDNSTWVDVPASTITVANNYTLGVLTTTNVPAAVNNQASVYLRWIMTSNVRVNTSPVGTVAALGTGRIDDIVVKGTAITTPSTLFFSEYVEGTSNDKALEIYNPTGATVNLATGTYTIEIYANGSLVANSPILALTGSIAPQGKYVITNTGCSPALALYSNQTGSLGFNGDDAIVLKENGTIIDVIGQVGFRPTAPAEWGTGLVSTLDNTIRRKCAITTGDVNGSDAFDPSIEWEGFANNTFDGLGAHCPTSVITVTGTLVAFTTTALNVASASQTYQVKGTSLTTDITVTAPAQFQVSLDGITFTSSVSVPFATANATNTTVYVRYLPTSGTSHTGNVANASTGASTVNVAVVGTVPPSLMTIAVARTRPINEIVTITGTLTAATQFAGPAFIQDATGGIAVFDAQIHGGAFQIGDTLTLTAKRVDFQNQIQLSNVTAFTDLGVATTPVVPQVITLNQLAAHRGELVKIVNATFPTAGGMFFGNSNYTVTNGINSGAVRIDADTDLAGRAQPAACDVIGVIGYFQTAPQLLPRFQADIPCSTPYTSATSSTVTPCIALNKTLEVTTWNIEWFGDEGNSPAGAAANTVQKDSVKVIIKANNADIYTLVEIVDMPLINQLAAELSTETGEPWAVLFSDFVSNPPANATAQRVGFLYKTNVIQPMFNYPLLKAVHPSYNGGSSAALVGYPDPDKSRFWASGRLPFWMRANVTLNGSSEEVDFIVIHGRANNSSDPQGRYDMRRYDVTVLEDSIRANSMLVGRKIIMAGDYNDDVDVTVANIPSTLTSFDAFTTRPTEYTFISAALSAAGNNSYVTQDNMIDHIMASNELANGYIPNSVSLGYEYYDSDYMNTVSDHFLVRARFEIVPIASCDFTGTANSSSQITLNWTDSTNIENSYVVEMSLNGVTGWTAIAGSPFVANSLTGVVTGLNASTQYFFRVRAEESATNFSPWVYTDATTLSVSVTPLVTLLSPLDNAINVPVATNLVLTFDRNVQAGTGNITVSDGVTPITFPIAGNAVATVTIATNTVTINLAADLVNATNYHVLIPAGAIQSTTSIAFAGFTTTTDWNFTTVAITPPTGGGGGTSPTVTTPANFIAIPVSTSQINLTWGNVSNASGYLLYRDNTLIATLRAGVSSFQDTGLNSDTFYNYRLVATNGGRISDPIQTNARTFPAAPSLLSVTNACSGSGGLIKVSSTGAVYRVYADSISTTPLFETDNASITSPSITQTTTFYVSVVSNGRESTRTAITINVNQLPIANILEDRIFSCAATGMITAQAITGASYTWLINGYSIATTTTPSYEVNRSGSYQVRITLNGCSATSDITPVVLNYLPVAEIAQGIIVRSCASSTIISARNTNQNDSTTMYEWTRNNVVVGNTASVSVSESGVYILTVTAFGCSATDQITVEINTINPNVSFTASQTTFCPEEEVTLTVTNPEQNVTYTWVRNGRVLRGSTGTEYTTSVGGEYRVQASQNSCAIFSTPITITRTRVAPVYLRKEGAVLSVESITPITDVVWLFEGEENTSLAGQMSFTPTEAGNYSARVTFETGCQGFTRTIYYSIPEIPVVTGEDDIISIETIVYPNPSKTGIFRVQLSTSITSDVTFTITDNIGRILENKVIKANETSTVQTLDLSQYAAGMYALTIDTEQGKVIKKIVIE